MTPLNPNQAHHEIQTILSSSDYQRYYANHQNFLTQLWNQFKQMIQHFLQRLFPGIHISNSTSQWVLYLVVGLILLFLLFLIFKLWTRFTQVGRYRYHAFSSEAELAQSVASHLKTAEEWASEGDFKRATRSIFLALILQLNNVEKIVAKPWKTNFEYTSELERQSDVDAQRFADFALFFDEIVYGNHPIEEEGYKNYHQKTTAWMERLKDVPVEQGGRL